MQHALVGVAGHGWAGWYWQGGYGWSWLWPIWLVVALLFWAGLIALVIWAVRATIAPHRRDNREATLQTAMEILRRKLAAGEVTPEEFERIRDLLED